MQNADIFFRFAGAILLWAFLGFVIAVGIKVLRGQRNIPTWPIMVSAVLGIVVSIARQSAAGLL
ncbi:MAG: hypothetical protein ACJ8EY_03265 [Sphingomicrobium sp.]